MAKFEDYVKTQDDLQEEIHDADEQAEVRREEPVIPKRFQGKTPEEIATSYEELESRFGKQSQELGHLRKTVDLLLEKQMSAPAEPQAPVEEIPPVTVDDIYNDPDAAIRRIANKEASAALKRVEELEARLQQTEAAKAEAEFRTRHTDVEQIARSAEFVEWVQKSPYRQRMAAQARDGDLTAADELLSTYKEITGSTKSRQSRRQAVQDASLETSGGSAPAPTETFSRSKLEALRVAARRGDSEAEAYLTANSQAILAAYAEGRISN